MSDAGLNRAYLLLGSNIAPESNLPAAVQALARHGRVIAVSHVYESAPVGYAEQPNFMNAAVLLLTHLSARALRFEAIAEIERSLGRRRDPTNKNGPRTIDIDVALFNREVASSDGLRIPDPNLHERLFVVRPLAELDPNYIHPETGRSLRETAAELERGGASLIPRPDVRLPQPESDN